jgi:hypothetical protein
VLQVNCALGDAPSSRSFERIQLTLGKKLTEFLRREVGA